MRLLALCGLLAVLSPPSVCERRNPMVCSDDPGFLCPENQYCKKDPAQPFGSCEPAQCSPSRSTCATDNPKTPICVSGQCKECTADNQCAALGAAAPVCDVASGRCVGCVSDGDCTKDPATVRPVCEHSTQLCRECQLHSECASGVCAKDDTFALLPEPILKGSCVPASRIITVNQTSLETALGMVDLAHPYVRVTSLASTTKVTVPALPDARLPAFYIVGPYADTPPSKLPMTGPTGRLENSNGQALVVPAGSHTVIEGLFMVYSRVGLECTGSAAQTKVKVLRSFFGGNVTAIKAGSRCDLTLDSSWLGNGPSPIGNISGNDLAMDLDSTQLSIVNSVFWRNGDGVGAPLFAGIILADSAGLNPLVRIVNSTFVEHVFSDNPPRVFAIDCRYATAGSVAIVNSLFLNSGTLNTGYTYVHQNCRPTGSIDGVASNDTALQNATQGVIDANLNTGIFVSVSAANGDLHLLANARNDVNNNGVLSFVDSQQRRVDIPTVDMEGKKRGGGAGVSIGAFEVNR